MSRDGVIAIGECMVELARGADGRFGLAYGGDTFNTAVYMARSGLAATYATALGDDPYSQGIVALARNEGINTDLIRLRRHRMPGLYLIETTATGERTFHYWRERSPARELPDAEDWPMTASSLANARLVYLSAITMSLYSDAGLDRLALALHQTRSHGGIVAIDGNFRPHGWQSGLSRARTVMERFWRLASFGLPTFDDENALWGDQTPLDTVQRLLALGVEEIAIKKGSEGAVIASIDGRAHEVPIPQPITAVDTTAAGDSFNAAYIASRLAGRPPVEATLAGHRLAGVVIRHRGAIAPREATAEAFR